MSDGTAIEWTDATWNPLRGCTRVSEGCKNCYAEIMAARFSKPGQWGHGLANMVRVHHTGQIDHRWTGKVILVEDQLDQPLRWKRPRRIFVNSTSDLFHESVPDEWIDRIFAVMALARQHKFQVLTKRPDRMRAYLARHDVSRPGDAITAAAFAMNSLVPGYRGSGGSASWPLPNVWLGTSIEDQATADTRIPDLLATPAAVRFISAEPLLGPVDLTMVAVAEGFASALIDPIGPLHLILDAEERGAHYVFRRRLDWVIVGGESGPGARPMHPDWARSLRDQCKAAGVAFFFKQWGEWAPDDLPSELKESEEIAGRWNGTSRRMGKKAAGRLLDGREWNQMPGAK